MIRKLKEIYNKLFKQDYIFVCSCNKGFKKKEEAKEHIKKAGHKEFRFERLEKYI